MSEPPLVSVVILNYNRRDILRRCVSSALELNWPRLEWIVVDNASDDGSAEMVETEFGPQVKVIKRTENSVTAARNQGFEQANGEYILSLDNDILMTDRDVIPKCLDRLSDHPETGLLSFKIGSEETPDRFLSEHWWHPLSIGEYEDCFFYTTFFPEAAAFFRRSVLAEAGMYDPDFFMAVEQFDLALNFLRAGYRILYCPELTCAEVVVRGQLALRKNRIHYLNTRNKFWIAWKHFPLRRALTYAAGRTLAGGLRALRFGYLGLFLKGLWDGVFAPASIRRKRQPLGPAAWEVYDRIQQGWLVEDKTA